MNILVLNQDWFVQEWRSAGHKVYSCGIPAHLDITLPTAHIHFSKVLEQIEEKFEPDIIVIHDNSGPIVVSGLEDTEIPVIFYSVDTHHHYSIHKYLAHLFDYSLVAQKDYISFYTEVGSTAEWMPLWASRDMQASLDKQYGAVFVGNLNPGLNPQRVQFFEELNKLTQVKTQIGKYWEIFPFSEIVINQTVKADLNFRVFEAMMSGAMLLTENTGNGLSDLFTDGTHLVTYAKGDSKIAAEKIHYYLNNLKLAREIGDAGREEVLKNHTSAIRAKRFMDLFSEVKKQNHVFKYFAAAANYCDLGLRAEKIDTTVSVKSYISALKCIDVAVLRQESLDTQLACYVVCAVLKYDQFLKTGAGNEMLFRMREAYPDQTILDLAVMRNYLNLGKYDLAKQIATLVSDAPSADTFNQAEDLISMILKGQSFCL